jgi:hypothetical protein
MFALFQAHQAEKEGLGESTVALQAYLGLAWAVGCGAFGMLVVKNSAECRIARQYLCQACTFMCGIAILALTAVEGYRGYLLFVWVSSFPHLESFSTSPFITNESARK